MDVDALVREHGRALVRYAFRLVGDADIAEDVAQEAFVRALDRPPGDERNARAWLFTVATNLVRDHARRARRAHRMESTLRARIRATAPPPPPADALAERRELRARLFAALDTLSERERTAVLMREEGFAHREIADALGTTTGTIGTLLARALAKLATALPLDGDEP